MLIRIWKRRQRRKKYNAARRKLTPEQIENSKKVLEKRFRFRKIIKYDIPIADSVEAAFKVLEKRYNDEKRN